MRGDVIEVGATGERPAQRIQIAQIPVCRLVGESRQVARIEREIAGLEPRRKDAEDQRRRRESLQKEIGSRKPVLGVIEELHRLTPAEITYSSLRIRPSGEMVLEGISRTSAAVNKLQGNLVESSLFKVVTLQQTAKRMYTVGEVTFFSIAAVVVQGHQ